MKKFLLLLFLTCMASASYPREKVVISTGTDIVQEIEKRKDTVKTLVKYAHASILEVDEKDLESIAHLAHETGRCGGFFYHDDLNDAKQSIYRSLKLLTPRNYTVQKVPLIEGLIKNVQEPRIQSFIRKLSNYHNRYYKSNTGVAAAKYIWTTWGQYADAKLYNHKSWKQPSVIATIPGSKYPNEIIVVGGHLDSISGWFGSSTKRAPGADDNASGIATITEILRVLSEAKYKPQRTIQFMGYAAEEVGLRGSNEIARDYSKQGVKVVGVMQFDMTNFKGSDKAIHLITDYTDGSQTKFLAGLIDTYLKVPYAETRCGYACSDHASWSKAGFPAVFPFEAAKGDMNRKIHTKGDTIEVSGGNASHAVNFARLGLAYVIEMDLQGVNIRSKQ